MEPLPLPSHWTNIIYGYRSSAVCVRTDQGTGSGSLVATHADKHVVMTCAHVVEKQLDRRVTIHSRGLAERTEAVVFHQNTATDVAFILVRSDTAFAGASPLVFYEREPRVDMEVVMLGSFSNVAGGEICQPGTSYGRITAFPSKNVDCDGGPLCEISANYAAIPGTSGSPVFVVGQELVNGVHHGVIGMNYRTTCDVRHAVSVSTIKSTVMHMWEDLDDESMPLSVMLHRFLDGAIRGIDFDTGEPL
ncbi:unnamed protein product [Alopecurus aequalis]